MVEGHLLPGQAQSGSLWEQGQPGHIYGWVPKGTKQMWNAGIRAQLASPSDRLPQPQARVQVGAWQSELQKIVLGTAGAHIRAETFPSQVHIPETWCSSGASSVEGTESGWLPGGCYEGGEAARADPTIPQPCTVPGCVGTCG